MKFIILFYSIAYLFILCSCQNYGTLIQNGSLNLYYTSTISLEEAKKLEKLLVEEKFNEGNKKFVQFNKNGVVYEFKVVVKKGNENDDEYIKKFKVFASYISEIFGNKEVDIHLCDDALNTLRVVIYTYN